jgi:ATP-dependent Clp protease ATP-binding subunit ClpB
MDAEARREAVLDEVRASFRPEFVNRIDEIVVFEPLGPEQIQEIVDIQLRVLEARLADRKLLLRLTDAARAYLAEKGYDPAFGARPLKRLIQREIQDALAVKLLAGEIGQGDEVAVDREGDGLVFRVGARSSSPSS